MVIPFVQPQIQSLDLSNNFHTIVDVLRLDLLHPVISGNKWYKLKYYIEAARKLGRSTLVTFGGAYSNHIVATAAAAQQAGMKSVGIIRGEKPTHLSPTLIDAESFGMELFYVSRSTYREKEIPEVLYEHYNKTDVYIVPEGGFGNHGRLGAAEILSDQTNNYSTIICAVGTGTTVAGLIHGALAGQKILGISVLKNNFQLQDDVRTLLTGEHKTSFDIIHDYHFGGYAKMNQLLLDFMNEFYDKYKVPTDFVYTGKLFFAVMDLISKGIFSNEKILVIHSGGLQGNRSLPKGTLIF